jgi:hypothetical protein
MWDYHAKILRAVYVLGQFLHIAFERRQSTRFFEGVDLSSQEQY